MLIVSWASKSEIKGHITDVFRPVTDKTSGVLDLFKEYITRHEKLLSPSFKKSIETFPEFKISFISPLGCMPPSMKDKTICGFEGCNKIGTYRCSQCNKIKYCGTDCQKKDWKKHKVTCLYSRPFAEIDVKKAITATSSKAPFMSSISRNTGQITKGFSKLETFKPLPSGKVFIVKLQISLSNTVQDFRIYDKHRTYDFLTTANELVGGTKEYKKIFDFIQKNPSATINGIGAKVYLDAEFSGSNLRIYLDTVRQCEW